MKICDILSEFKELPQAGENPEVLTLTEKNGFVRQSDRFSKRLATEDLSKYKLIHRDDFAFNPYLLWAGAIARNDRFDEGVISPLYPTFKANADHDPAYIQYFLLSPPMLAKYDNIAFGSVPRRRRSSVKDFLNLSIPDLPPLTEQQRIAEILEVVATTISSSQEQLAALSQIQENLLTDTGQVDYVPLGDLAQIRSGTVKPNEHPYCDLPHVAPDNIESGTGRLQNINTALEDGVTSNKYAFYAGDLLYSKIRPYLNKFAIPQFDGVCSADMYALIPKKPATVEYLAMTLQSPMFLAYAEQQSGRASIPKINRKSLTSFPVPFHSEAEIQRVTEIYQETETARSVVERKLNILQELQNSLSTRAFAGQL